MTTDLKRRLIIFGVVLLAGVLFLLPTIAPQITPSEWLSRPITLGLDLKGGVHLVYQVETAEAVKSQLQTTANSIKSDLRKEKIPVTRALVNNQNQLEVTVLNPRYLDRAKKKIEENYRTLTPMGEKPGDNEEVKLTYGIGQSQAAAIEKDAVDRALETLRNRIDQFGVTEPLIQKVGEKRIMLQMPGVTDVAAVKKVVGSVAKLEFRFLPDPGTTANTITLKTRDGETERVEDVPVMTGEAVQTARVGFDRNQVVVNLSFTSEGTRTFRRITTENVNRRLAIILDNIIYSSPNINEPIVNGAAEISGGFKMDEAKQLAVVLRSGALPAPLTVLEERTVGPTLGRESIRKGIWASVLGILAIFVFMTVYYKKSGLVAIFTLFVNLFLVLAALSAFGATLTLPGLAGLALTIGMAVDSNVIIFERIREELRNGAGRDAAVSAGFQHAMVAIVDANVTTLLSGLILYWWGTGPIRGFAVTLSIGIATTIYCAVIVARLAYDLFPLTSKKQLSI